MRNVYVKSNKMWSKIVLSRAHTYHILDELYAFMYVRGKEKREREKEKEWERERGKGGLRNRDWGRFPLILNKERKVVLFPPGFQTVWNSRGVKYGPILFLCFAYPFSALCSLLPFSFFTPFWQRGSNFHVVYWCCQFNFSWRIIVVRRKGVAITKRAAVFRPNRLYLSWLCTWQLLTSTSSVLSLLLQAKLFLPFGYIYLYFLYKYLTIITTTKNQLSHPVTIGYVKKPDFVEYYKRYLLLSIHQSTVNGQSRIIVLYITHSRSEKKTKKNYQTLREEGN